MSSSSKNSIQRGHSGASSPLRFRTDMVTKIPTMNNYDDNIEVADIEQIMVNK